MKDTRATRILATVFHKHKYITNPGVTPEDRAIATEVKLVAEIKVIMANHLSKMALEQLEQLGTIINQGWTQKDNQQRTPPSAPPRQTSKVQVALTQKVGSGVPIPKTLSTPHLPFQHPNRASHTTSEISPTETVPRVVPPPWVEQPETPRRSP